MQSNNGMQPSYRGFVETTGDAHGLIEACLRGSLPFVRGRPTPLERALLAQSGHIFIFEETASGIKRWTDGKRWTPSRALNEFLVYGELNPAGRQSRMAENANQAVLNDTGMKGRHDQLYGPLAKSFNLLPEAMVKKTISLKHLDRTWHVVSYYRPVDVLEDRLKSPSLNLANQDMMHVRHFEGSLMPRDGLSLSHQAGENMASSSIWPWDIWTPTLMDVGQYYHTSNELDHDHCIVQQKALPYSGVVDTEVMPGPMAVNETYQLGLNLEPLWSVMGDLEAGGCLTDDGTSSLVVEGQERTA